jgi:hypothetical protein
MVRELILERIKELLEGEDCDEDLLETYGSYEIFTLMSDVELLEAYEYAVGFRG